MKKISVIVFFVAVLYCVNSLAAKSASFGGGKSGGGGAGRKWQTCEDLHKDNQQALKCCKDIDADWKDGKCICRDSSKHWDNQKMACVIDNKKTESPDKPTKTVAPILPIVPAKQSTHSDSNYKLKCPDDAHINDECFINPNAKLAKCMNLGMKDSGGGVMLSCAAWECNDGYNLWMKNGKSQGICRSQSYIKSQCQKANACSGCGADKCVPNLVSTPRTGKENGAWDGCVCDTKNDVDEKVQKPVVENSAVENPAECLVENAQKIYDDAVAEILAAYNENLAKINGNGSVANNTSIVSNNTKPKCEDIDECLTSMSKVKNFRFVDDRDISPYCSIANLNKPNGGKGYLSKIVGKYDNPACAGLNPGEWEITFPYGTVKGTYKCAKNAGQVDKEHHPIPGNPEGEGGFCWCTVTEVPYSNFASNIYVPEDAEAGGTNYSVCKSSCSSSCVFTVQEKTDFRKAIFGFYGK